MSWTKQNFVTRAFEEIGIASYVYDLQPEQLQAAMERMDSMMATWNGRGIRVGYPIPGTPGGGNLTDDTGVPDWANEAIYTNLALRLAPTVGKNVSVETKNAAKTGFNVLLQRASYPDERQFPDTVPSGAGNKRSIDQPYLNDPVDNLQAGRDSILTIE